jgi:flagellar basal-body rod modification protein FlgD
MQTFSTKATDSQALIAQLNANQGAKNTPTSVAGESTSSAGQTDRFLKLLVAQMSNQDPLNPLDNAQVTSQMAQISTVEGISKMNTSLDALTAQGGGTRAIDAASLIGRSALVAGNQLNYSHTQGTARGAVELKEDAAKVRLEISDDKGLVVRKMDLSNVSKGVNPFLWDGLNSAGKEMPDGNYSIIAIANPDGAKVNLDVFIPAKVTAVVGNQSSLRVELQGYGLKQQDEIKGFL